MLAIVLVSSFFRRAGYTRELSTAVKIAVFDSETLGERSLETERLNERLIYSIVLLSIDS